MDNLMPVKEYDLTEITRLLLKMRDNCIRKDGDAYDDPERETKFAALNDAIHLINNPSRLVNGDTSDGYHTFNELYHHRAVLFSVIVKAFPDKAWKARKHHDGSMYDGMFIVGIETPDGQASYHYDIDPYWDMFDCREVEFAPEWDGHTAAQAIERIGKLEPVVHGRWIDKGYITTAYGSIETGCCPVCGAVDVPIEPYDYYCPNCNAKMDLE